MARRYAELCIRLASRTLYYIAHAGVSFNCHPLFPLPRAQVEAVPLDSVSAARDRDDRAARLSAELAADTTQALAESLAAQVCAPYAASLTERCNISISECIQLASANHCRVALIRFHSTKQFG